jgi:hypothetical protein
MSIIQGKTLFTKKLDELIIRTAAKKDAEAIITLMKKVISESHYTLAEPEEYKATKITEEEKIYLFNKTKGKLLIVAEVENEIAGYLVYSNWPLKRTSHSGMLSMFLFKEYRDK